MHWLHGEEYVIHCDLNHSDWLFLFGTKSDCRQSGDLCSNSALLWGTWVPFFEYFYTVLVCHHYKVVPEVLGVTTVLTARKGYIFEATSSL